MKKLEAICLDSIRKNIHGLIKLNMNVPDFKLPYKIAEKIIFHHLKNSIKTDVNENLLELC